MSDYYTESQVNRIEEAAYNGAIFEAGKEWERQRDEFNSREHELQSRIAELEVFIDKLIEIGDRLVFPDGVFDDEQSVVEHDWRLLTTEWKEREE